MNMAMKRQQRQKSFHKKLVNKEHQTGEHIKQLTPYINYNNKIHFKCLDCGCIFKCAGHTLVKNKYRHRLCPKALKKYRKSMHLKKYGAIFKTRLKKRERITHEHIKIISNYLGRGKKICFKCLDCGKVFKATPEHILSKHKLFLCPNKSNKYRGLEQRQKAAKKFHKKFIEKQRKTKEHIKQLTPYINSSTKIRFKCLKCGYIFKEYPSDIYECAHICPRKYVEIGTTGHKKTMKQFKQQVYDLVGNEYIVLSKHYTCTHDKVWMEHHSKNCIYYKKHHKFYKFKVTPDDFLCAKHGKHGTSRGIRCPADFKTPRKTTKQFANEIKRLTSNEFILKSKYGKTNQDSVLIEHHSKHCTYYKKFHRYYTFVTTPNLFLKRLKCPYENITEGESRVQYWLEKHGLRPIKNYYYSYVVDDYHLHLDFYLPYIIYNKYYFNGIGIEFDGDQHFEPVPFDGKDHRWVNYIGFVRGNRRDRDKNKMCKTLHVKLIRIKNKKDLEGNKLTKLVNHVLNKELLPTLKVWRNDCKKNPKLRPAFKKVSKQLTEPYMRVINTLKFPRIKPKQLSLF